jgi:hypothetical protein
MKQKNTILKNYRKRLRPGKTAEGFITVMMIPAFLTLLGFATAIAGSVSYSIQAMTHRNEMMQAYSLLEDDEVTWQDKALSAKWEELYKTDYERVVSTQKVGPFILLIKEMRHKTTGKTLVNHMEFIPIGKTGDDAS